jgi:hypothetical protein
VINRAIFALPNARQCSPLPPSYHATETLEEADWHTGGEAELPRDSWRSGISPYPRCMTSAAREHVFHTIGDLMDGGWDYWRI